MTTTATRRPRTGSGTGSGRADRARRPDTRPPRRRWPWVLAVVLLLAVIGGAVYVVRSTPMFAVRQVAVVGVGDVGVGERVTAEVRRATADEVGTPLIRVDTAAVRARVAALPDVAAVSVERGWPNTLTVSVTPRVPVAVTNANDAWWLMDAAGLPYRSTPDKPAGLIPVELAAPGPGDPATAAALCVVEALPADLPVPVTAIRAESPYRVVLQLADERSVVWGDCSSSVRKAAVLPVMLAQPGTVFDISDPSMVTVT